MNIPLEFLQLAGFVLFGLVTFVFGIAWGRKYPSKVEKLNEQLKALEAQIKEKTK